MGPTRAWVQLTLEGHEALLISSKLQPSILLRGCGNVNVLQLPPNVALAVPAAAQHT
jgi:hypothetical protein